MLEGGDQERVEKARQGSYCQKCGGWRGALGNEPALEMYIGHLVAIYKEVYRCLRDDGCAFVVMGDSFSSQGGPEPAQTKWQVSGASNTQAEGKSRRIVKGLSQGNLMMVPHRLALALQADGWVIRNDLVWKKVAPMPESVSGHRWERHKIKIKHAGNYGLDHTKKGKQIHRINTRCATTAQYIDCPGCLKCEENGGYVLKRGSWRHTRAHEFVLMCTKKMQYFTDQEKVREPINVNVGWRRSHPNRVDSKTQRLSCVPGDKREFVEGPFRAGEHPAGRNPRSVLYVDAEEELYQQFLIWRAEIEDGNPSDVLTPKPTPFPGKHFAVFSTNLIEPLIKAACPDKCCPECGKGWSPIVEKETCREHGGTREMSKTPLNVVRAGWRKGGPESNILGYRPTCECFSGISGEQLNWDIRMGLDEYAPVPGTVLDPFGGAGTTGLVAERLGLNATLIEISLEYAEMSRKRILDDAPLLNKVEMA